MICRRVVLNLVVVFGCLVLFLVQPASAYILNSGDSVRIYNDITPGTGGGPFTLKVEPQPGGAVFQTFCVELNEFFVSGELYYVTIEHDAIFGGGGAIGTPPDTYDPLDSRSAFLYKSFVQGTLDGQNINGTVFDSSDDSHKNAMQEALWYIEEERDTVSGLAASLVTWAGTQNTSTANDVRVLNVWSLQAEAYTVAGKRQSMLTIVPEPAAIIGWGLLAGVFGGGLWVRRRRRNA